MKEYTYKFADGTTSTVEVDEELYAVLEEMDKQEHNNDRSETRRSESYESMEEQCIEPGKSDDYFVKEAFQNMDNEELQFAISELPFSQQVVLKLKFYDDKTFPEIAEILGVSVATIYKRYERIIKKLKNFFGIVEN